MNRREELERAIDHALDLLNRMDGDADLERDDDLEEGGDMELTMQSPFSYRAA